MAEIRISTERELMALLIDSPAWKHFRAKSLPAKIERETRAWQLLKQHQGGFTRDVLTGIFDTVDTEPDSGARWFGSLLATPNRNLIFQSPDKVINDWIGALLFRRHSYREALDICLQRQKVKGAGKGLATLLLYLSDFAQHNVWVNATEEGLATLNRIGEIKGKDWGARYDQFNNAALRFRGDYGLKPAETDWALWFVGSHVERDDDHFVVDEDLLETKEVRVAVDDETDVEVVGEPMELGVMRWTPTNEMGVVALFIEYRRQLGFPIIEVIRTRFPDAVVFEAAIKGHVRRYIEFEFRSSGFKAHATSKRKCDYVVCWEHDWKDCPVPVRELKREIPAILASRNP